MTDRQTTHATGCWGWGPRHYECAIGQIERDEALLRQALEALEFFRDTAICEASTTLEEAASHARVCSGLAEQPSPGKLPAIRSLSPSTHYSQRSTR